MTTLVSLDGTITPADKASVPVFDRGFLYGDSVYEVTRTYRGVPFELEAHLERLVSSAARIGMNLPVETSVLAQEIHAVHRASGNPDSYIRLVVTRGSGRIGLDPALAENGRRIVICQDVEEMKPKAAAYEDGVRISLVGVRKNLKTAIDPQAKTGNYLNSVLALREARETGAYEAVMLDHQGFLTEGSSSNIFLVLGGLLFTPPLEAGILRGVTRTVVLKVAREAGIRTLELPLGEAAIGEADEVFITSSVREVVPVVRVDDVEVSGGKPGPLTCRIRALYEDYIQAYTEARAKRRSS